MSEPFVQPHILLEKACEALRLYEEFEAALLNDDNENLIEHLTNKQYNLMMGAQAARNEVLYEIRRQEQIKSKHEKEFKNKRGTNKRMFYGESFGYSFDN